MAAYQRTEYRIQPDGSVTIAVLNGEGESCLQATQAAETALGEVQARQVLPEFYRDPDAEVVTQVRAEVTA
jgi:hypothetical protein